ncbi:MAG: hypothetical protein IPO17_10470 [Flavobacteriales bacterium]|nr:hypothetical protein [Flavobacteriales bacterium]
MVKYGGCDQYGARYFHHQGCPRRGELIAMANAIGLDNVEDLKGFDIRHLGDWKTLH